MTATDWIQFWLSIGTWILAFLSIILVVISIVQNSITNFENTRAKIIFYIDYIRSTDKFYLTIKNFGNSIGKLNYIKISPNLNYNKVKGYNNKHTLLTDSKNIILAPNQKISSWFSFRNYPDKIFDIEIQYETLNKRLFRKKHKVYTEQYKIDLSFINNVESLSHYAIDCENEIQALIWIEHQLSEISERLK